MFYYLLANMKTINDYTQKKLTLLKKNLFINKIHIIY